jgi:mannose-6-phosphate isomerase-like protein (cupin superfamily)
MTMTHIRPSNFTPKKAWQALDIANMNGITTRLHWTNQPYQWHTNDGQEVFVVLTGAVDMHYREAGLEKIVRLEVGDIFFADVGCEHVAHPAPEARVLVVEKAGSR